MDIVAPPWPAAEEVEYPDVGRALAEFDAGLVGNAREATDRIIGLLKQGDFDGMARHSPELKGIDWAPYLDLSVLRVVRVVRSLLRSGVPRGARVLDFGAYFGNFALTLAKEGFAVDALDAYEGAFGGALAPFERAMTFDGVRVMDVAGVGYDLSGVDAETYDAVVFMGAIEHIPHTPRETLAAITRCLKPGGVLVMDTPNVGYVYTRRKLLSGQSIFPPIKFQFETEIPFFGHHREYLPDEVRWMLERSGQEIVEDELFCFSALGLSELRGEQLALWRVMEQYPQLRELYFVVSRKKSSAA
jgi:SAM-dependent methyltransferase